MSNDIQYPELPPHLVWFVRNSQTTYVLRIANSEGVAWAEQSGSKYRCTSAPHGALSDEWVEQFASTEQEAVNLIHAWAVMETRHE